MKRNRIAIRTFLTVAGTVLAVGLDGQAVSTLNFGALLTKYFDVAYADRPQSPSRHMYFNGENIELTLEVGNPSSDTLRLDTSVALSEAFGVEVVRAPAQANRLQIVANPDGEMVASAASAVRWGESFQIDSRSTISWPAELVGATAAGAYEIRVTPRFGSSTSRLNLQSTVIRLEVRQARLQSDRAEVARRRMMREYLFGTDANAREAVQALLDLHPQSAVAHEIRGRLEARAGRSALARASFDQSIALIESGSDQFLMQHNRKAELESFLAGVRSARDR
jgi:hypothetical protein